MWGERVGFGAEGRVREESDCSRCKGRSLEGHFRFPPQSLGFPSGPSPLCSLAPKVPRSLLGALQLSQVCFHLSDWNSLHPACPPKPSGAKSAGGSQQVRLRVELSLKEPNGELHNNVFPHQLKQVQINQRPFTLWSVSKLASSRHPPDLLNQCLHKAHSSVSACGLIRSVLTEMDGGRAEGTTGDCE